MGVSSLWEKCSVVAQRGGEPRRSVLPPRGPLPLLPLFTVGSGNTSPSNNRKRSPCPRLHRGSFCLHGMLLPCSQRLPQAPCQNHELCRHVPSPLYPGKRPYWLVWHKRLPSFRAFPAPGPRSWQDSVWAPPISTPPGILFCL